MITEEQISELLDGMVFERGSFPHAIGIVQGWLADAWESGRSAGSDNQYHWDGWRHSKGYPITNPYDA